jgi:hypothetical protein
MSIYAAGGARAPDPVDSQEDEAPRAESPEGGDRAAKPERDTAAAGGSRMSVMAALTTGRGGAGAAGEEEEPKLPHGKDFSKTDFKAAHGPLFTHGVSPGDVGQGKIGDCFFLSSLAAVAQRKPDLIKNALKDNGDGTYTVTFKERQKDGSVKDVPVTVDDKLPMDGTHPAFAQGRDGTKEGAEIWPSIVEKAYAKYRGGYDTLNQGGLGQKALETLTGAPSEHFDIGKVTEDDLWQRISKATADGKPMVTGTTTKKGLDRATNSGDEGGFVEGHDYTLLGTEEKDGQRFVKLRNPWASDSPHVPGVERKDNDDGVFEIPLATYRKTFADVAISGA